jgi:hypothetical protein
LFPVLFVFYAFLYIMLIAKNLTPKKVKLPFKNKIRKREQETKQKFNCMSLSVLLPRRFNVINCAIALSSF